MKLIFLASKELSWLWNLGFHFPKLDYPQCLKVHILPFGKSIYLEEFNMVVYYQTVCYSRKKLSRGLGSPSSRQLLQLQLFSQIFEISDPPFLFYLGWECVDSWTLFCSSIYYSLVWSEVNCFHAFRKIVVSTNALGRGV